MKEYYFEQYRKNVIGFNSCAKSHQFCDSLIYADWCGSGKLYKPIEEDILFKYGPLYSNLHSASNNSSMSFIEKEYYKKRESIKKHFGLNNEYELILNGQGMTTAINQCIDILKTDIAVPSQTVVFISPYEHNSNFITWREKKYKIEVLRLDKDGLIDLNYFEMLLKKYSRRKKIVSITACSNVTGIIIPLDGIGKICKKYDAVFIVDYTACAPYIDIDMATSDVDVLVCSSHKFVGGVQGVGILIIKKELYRRNIPSNVGGGTVRWVNPYGNILYWDDIHLREEAGTVPILQTIRTGLAIELKEKIGSKKIMSREKEITQNVISKLNDIDDLRLFFPNVTKRLPIFSFIVYKKDYKDVVNSLYENVGAQVRGGCCCASILAHTVLGINEITSNRVYNKLLYNISEEHNFGWTRISLNYLNSNQEIDTLIDGLKRILAEN